MYLAQASRQKIYLLIYLRMIFKTMIELFQGNLTKVQYVKYSNGKTVKRILDKNGIPQLVIEL